jgi:hypothetical protein
VFDFRCEDLPHFITELVRRRTRSNGVFARKIRRRTYSKMSERFGFEFDMLPQPNVTLTPLVSATRNSSMTTSAPCADALNQQWADGFRENHAMLIQEALRQ